MELRLRFNEDPAHYDRWRPAYPAPLYHDLISFARLGAPKSALEVGIGTGQATLPIVQTGCRVTAVELGEAMAAFSKQKFAAWPNLKIVTGSFEGFDAADETYDLLYAATAFHWIPPEIAFPKAFRLLKRGGAIALFWNHPFPAPEDAALFEEIESVYDRFKQSNQRPEEFGERNCEKYVKLLNDNGFADVECKLYRSARAFSSRDYIALLNTYSDHRAMPDDKRAELESGIAGAIERHGGMHHIRDTIDLYLARRP